MRVILGNAQLRKIGKEDLQNLKKHALHCLSLLCFAKDKLPDDKSFFKVVDAGRGRIPSLFKLDWRLRYCCCPQPPSNARILAMAIALPTSSLTLLAAQSHDLALVCVATF